VTHPPTKGSLAVSEAPALHPVIYNDHAHLAGSLVALKAAVDAHWPGRDTRSDGGIGDPRHQAEGNKSDHNPWLNDTVRAYDFTVTQPGIHGVDGPWLTGGGYVIYDKHITAADFSHWTPYTGDPHTNHVHVSVTRSPGGYEYTGAWAFLATAPLPSPPIPHPAPVPAPPAEDVKWTGHDAIGVGDHFRAELGDQGPKVKELQHDLNAFAPAYSHLQEDGAYGHATEAVVEEFDHRAAQDPELAAQRSALEGADGENIGPAGAHALHHYGLI
jgi:hypothetical protein